MDCLTEEQFRSLMTCNLPLVQEQQAASHLAQCETCRIRLDERLQSDMRQWNAMGSRQSLPDASLLEELGSFRHLLYGMDPFSDAPAHRSLARPAEPAQTSAGDSGQSSGESLVHLSYLSEFTRFDFQRKLGEGGFGVVYLACDKVLRRHVAVKLPRAATMADRGMRDRFLLEAEAAAQLEHPHILPVFEAGICDQTPYLVTAYCPGPSLQAWLRERAGAVDMRSMAELMAQLASAVAHAHARGVLHRDIKPGNVLLEPATETRFGYVPKLSDFGLAKLLDRQSDVTGSLMVLGTPRYMAPEQVSGRKEQIGKATDVYALGLILYELLTGRPAVSAADADVTLNLILSHDPLRPRLLSPSVPPDLEAICLKCLEKRPTDRYQTAEELESDLDRYLNGQPTHARPLSRVELARRWARRQPATAAGLAMAILAWGLLSIGLIGYVLLLSDFNRQIKASLSATRTARQRAESSELRLRKELHIADVNLAHRALTDGDVRQAATLLRSKPAPENAALRDVAWRILDNLTSHTARPLESLQEDVYHLQLAPDGQVLAAACQDGHVRLYDLPSKRRLREWDTGQGEVNSVAFSPCGQYLATAGDDGSLMMWERARGRRLRTIPAFAKLAFQVLYSPDGRLLMVCGNDRTIRLWHANTGEPAGKLEGHQLPVEAIAISPDGSQLASASSDTTVRLWDLASQKTIHSWESHEARVTSVQFSKDGQQVAAGGVDGKLFVWNVADKSVLLQAEHLDGVQSLDFAQVGRLVAGDRGGTIRVWNVSETARGPKLPNANESAWPAHEGRIWSILASPSGEILSAGEDGHIYIAPPPEPPVRRIVTPPGDDLLDVAVGDQLLVVVRQNVGIQVLEMPELRERARLPQNASGWTAACFVDSGTLLLGTEGGGVLRWNMTQQHAEPLFAAAHREPLHALWHTESGGVIAGFYPDSDSLVLWPKHRSAQPREFRSNVWGASVSPDGHWLAMSDGDNLKLWDLPSGQVSAHFSGHSSTVLSVAFSPDSRMLATSSRDRHVRVWDRATRRMLYELKGHRDGVSSVAFSHSGRTLASGDGHGQIILWDLETGSELMRMASDKEPTYKLIFSPADQWLIAVHPHRLTLLDARPQSDQP